MQTLGNFVSRLNKISIFGMNVVGYLPIAWQHINFYGRYEFSKSPTVVNLDAIIKETDILTRLAQENSLKEKP